jgi:hypothetical protein
MTRSPLFAAAGEAVAAAVAGAAVARGVGDGGAAGWIAAAVGAAGAAPWAPAPEFETVVTTIGGVAPEALGLDPAEGVPWAPQAMRAAVATTAPPPSRSERRVILDMTFAPCLPGGCSEVKPGSVDRVDST